MIKPETFSIIYEDKHIICVDKNNNVLSQADSSKRKNILDDIKEYIKVRDNKEGNVFLALVHRLDYLTSGLMVFAKRSKSASRLSDYIRQKNFDKYYLLVVDENKAIMGNYNQDKLNECSNNRLPKTNHIKLSVKSEDEDNLYSYGIMEDYLIKKDDQRVYVADNEKGGAKFSKLAYKRLVRKDGLALYMVLLITGRQHQIRVQFSSRGLFLLGDDRYARTERAKAYQNLSLHSFAMSFLHPMDRELLFIRTDIPSRDGFLLFNDFLKNVNLDLECKFLKDLAEAN